MESFTQRGAGKVHIDIVKRKDKLSSVSAGFLRDLADGSVEYSKKFINAIDEAPFSYREKQSTGMVAYSLSQFADTFQTETPLQRRGSKKNEKSFGWVDFWAYKGNTDFFLELKQSYFYLQPGRVTQELYVAWERVNAQVNSFSNQDINDSCVSYQAVFVPFLIIPVYFKIKKSESYAESIANYSIDDAYQKIKSTLSPTPRWGYLWKVKQELVERTKNEEENNTLSYLPALIFLSNPSHSKL